MTPNVTPELSALLQRSPGGDGLEAAKAALAHLEEQARSIGGAAAAALVHFAMGRIWLEQLGDPKSAAVCYQNAFLLDPGYRPVLEAARRLFAGAGLHDKAIALHRREEALLLDAAEKAESLRAQARLLREAGRIEEAQTLTARALDLSPEHPALLQDAIEDAANGADRTSCARLLLRAAAATADTIHKARHLRRAILMLEEMLSEPASGLVPPATAPARATPAELEALLDEAVTRLHAADPHDPLGGLALLGRARAQNDWETVLRLCRTLAERTGSAADRALVAAIAALRLGRAAEGLDEVRSALETHPRDAALLSLLCELAEQHKPADLADALRRWADAATEPTERAHLKLRAAGLVQDPLERERLLSEALTENPADAAAIALHARMVAARDPGAAAERFAALGGALAQHAPEEAASHFVESASWWERAGKREEAAGMARHALRVSPRHGGALRLLTRILPLLGFHGELADLLESVAPHLPKAAGAELLSRASLLCMGQPEQDRALHLARRAAEMARGLASPRWLETWSLVTFRAGSHAQLSQALEARADSTHGADAAELLLEASELSRAVGDEARSTALLRKARGVDPQSAAARAALLALPSLSAAERVELLLEESREAAPERAAALHAERAAVLDEEGRIDDAVQACAQALASGDADGAVLRRLARLHLRRGDHAEALAVLAQIAESVPEGAARAEAFGRAAEVAEWRAGEARRAIELYRAAARAHPQATFAWTQLGRLHAWAGEHVQAAEAYERRAAASKSVVERSEARRWAASIFAHRASGHQKAAQLLRDLLHEAPGDLEAAGELLSVLAAEGAAETRRERAELRGRLAARCQDPGVAALLRSEAAQERLAAGDRDQAVAESRHALALNPQDRVALDHVEDALRAGPDKALLAEHLAFRIAGADPQTREALALEQAELPAAKRALDEVQVSRDPEIASAVEAALLAADPGDREQAVRQLTQTLEADPDDPDAGTKLRALFPEDPARHLSGVYERIGHAHPDAKLGARAWTHAAAILLHELNDAAAAFFATGRALTREAENLRALELRAEAAEAAGRLADAAEALQKRLGFAVEDEGRLTVWKLRLGRLYAQLGEASKAAPLLGSNLDQLPPALLLKVAPAATGLPPADAARLYRKLLDAFPAPTAGGVTTAHIASWLEGWAQAQAALGQPTEALEAFRRVAQIDPANRAALRSVTELAATRDPAEAIAAHRRILELEPGAADSLHELVRLFQAQGDLDAAFCAAATLVGAGLADAQESALYETVTARPPPAELPQLADGDALHAQGDAGPVHDLLAAAAPDLARALGGDVGARGVLVKGDNPVRRVVSAIARALGVPDAQLLLARAEPSVVCALAVDPPGLLVGAEVPKRFSTRQQRFLYARALAHIRRGTHPLAAFPPDRVAALAAELVRLAAPPGTDLSLLPARDDTTAEHLAAAIPPASRQKLAALAARAAATAPASWETLALAIRESAERAGLAVCGDPAAALSLVMAECPGGLHRPEAARLAAFAVSEAHLALRR